MPTNFKEFEAVFRRFTHEHVRRDFIQFQTAVALKILAAAAALTRVDTGLLRGNWQASLDSDTQIVRRSTLDRNGSATLSAAEQALSSYAPTSQLRDIVVGNPIEYAIHQENGTPNFPPQRMLGRALQQIANQLR